jgi:quercetin dioxygenase-like cupin family protein
VLQGRKSSDRFGALLHLPILSPRSIFPVLGIMILSALVSGGDGLAQAPAPGGAAPQPAAPKAAAPPPAAAKPGAPTPASAGPEPKLGSTVFVSTQLAVEKRPNGIRRAVLDAPTATVDRLHAHITTLNPGEKSGEPRLHLQEEVIIVTEGALIAHFDGQKREAPTGSVIFFQSNAVTYLENPGPKPASYYVVYYHTPLTPKE